MAKLNVSAADNFEPVQFVPKSAKGKIRIPKMAELVAENIRNRILNGELKEGASLPSEGKLLEAFNISRPTLREAYRILETEKLISISRGSRSGATVHAPKIDSVSRYMTYVMRANNTPISDIYDARLAIEPFAVRRLAEQRPKETVERLRQEEVGGNQTLHLLVELINDIMAAHQIQHLSLRPFSSEEQRKRSQVGIKSFFRLIEYIENGDVDGAEAHWRLHLKKTNEIWVSDPTVLAPNIS